MTRASPAAPVDGIDRRIVQVTQEGLPLSSRPYHAVAESLGLEPGEVMARMRRMEESGVIRRIGIVPNHYTLGFRANGMSVWDVPDERVSEIGARIGAKEFVSHCYHRPRLSGVMPYNLYAMIHGRTRGEVEARVEEIAAEFGDVLRRHDVLYSTRILKKTGLRLGG